MTAIIFILIIFSILYLIIALVTISGIGNKTARHNKNTPFVSVVLAAKDEEHNIQNCLNSLKNINYPCAKIEYLLVNDRSQDKTRFYMKQFSNQRDNVKILDIENLPENRTGKINALIKGANAAQGDVLIFTDADCEVPENWVKSFVEQVNS
ncbi:MAG: glycosyltransferase, partial [bacterium]